MLFFFLNPFHYSSAQKLEIGYRCPDLKMDNIFNYKSDTISLSEFKGKMILLVFWNHACSSCIANFPQLDALQKEFGSKLQIILVNKESKDSTNRFFSVRNALKIPQVPIHTGDTLLSKIFPSQGYPYTIWLDTNRIIRYAAYGENSTAKNIISFLKGDNLHFRNLTADVSYGSSFITENDIDNYGYFSYISHCTFDRDIGNTSGELIQSRHAVRTSVNCSSIIDLYKTAYQEFDKYSFTKAYSIKLSSIDSSKYMMPADHSNLDQWLIENSYNYDQLIPVSKSSQRYKIMQEDLVRYFELDARVVRVKMKSLVLKRLNGISIMQTKGGRSSTLMLGSVKNNVSDSIRYIHNKPFDELIRWLKLFIEYRQPFFDETKYSGNVDMNFRAVSIDPVNITELKKDLRKYNLVLEEKERFVDVLFIGGQPG